MTNVACVGSKGGWSMERTVSAVDVLHSEFEFRALGTVEVVADGEPLPAGGPKQRTVLAVLLANMGRRVSTESLIDGVYGADPPDGVRRSVQTYVSNLRGELGDLITAQPDGYLLDVARDRLDVTAFEDAVEEAGATLDRNPEHVAERLRGALRLWRGHPYADVDGGSVVATEIARLSELRLVAMELRIEADLAMGRHVQLVPELEALVAEHPYRERFAAQLMVALYRSGRQAEALQTYGGLRKLLVNELGIDPSPELRELEQQILTQDDRLAFRRDPAVGRRALLAVDVDADMLGDIIPSEQRVEALVATDSVVTETLATYGGGVFAQRLNATFAWFGDPKDALGAARDILTDTPPLHDGRRLVRIAVDVGDVEVVDGDMLVGPVVTRLGGLMGMAHPGQILLSDSAQAEAASQGGLTLKGLGPQPIPQLDRTEGVFQLVVAGTESDFPPPRTDVDAVLPGAMRMMPGYELRERVSQGRNWVVWRAYQPSVGREVAIKIIAPDSANRPDFVRRFELEALTVARLEHPHIVPLFDYWRDTTGAYLVSRWVDGGSLARRVAERTLDINEATRLIDEIGSALDTAHRSGITHGHVSPTSILVDKGGAFYLRDFGIAADEASAVDVGGRSVERDFSDLVATLEQVADATIFPSMQRVSPDGDYLLTSPRDEPVRIWDARDGSQVAELYPERTQGAALGDFDPSNPNHLTVMADHGVLLTYTLDTDELIEIARSRLTRGLTDDECVTFLHLPDGCPTG